MGGLVSYGKFPFSFTVSVGDVTSGESNNDPGISLATVEAQQFVADDIDDGTPEGSAKADAYMKEQVAAGVFNQSAIDRGNSTIARETDTTAPKESGPMAVDCEEIHRGFTLSTRLTPNTTLGDFINKLPILPNNKLSAVPAQMGLKPDEIVCNLASLCKNVWEPIKTKYPNAVMTNNLRTGGNIGAGPHGTGQATDLQFIRTSGGSISPGDYFAIAQFRISHSKGTIGCLDTS
ncbi:hypothetical protein EBU95_20345 [bacterium]|nr:hypothetical protein [bacterium]